jgi:CSLREA domain-containing protein
MLGRQRGRVTIVSAVLALASLVAAPTAFADFFAVTKHGDHAPGPCTKSDCTLREAILAANANPGRDRLLLASKRPYHLSRTGLPDDGALRGDLDITNDPLRIYHGSSGWATIDAQGVDRVFEIFANAPTTLENLRITGGDHPTSHQGDGGGIHTSANLTLENCILTGNHARGANGSGGGLQALDGKLSILGSEIKDNVAADSSGALDIGNHGFTIKDSTISGNRSSFAGAGYFYGDGDSTIGNSTISGNRSTTETGGIYYSESAGTLFISRSTFSGNVAADDGGGLSARNGEVKIVNSTFAGNRAGDYGGGVWAAIPVRLNAVTIARNVADSDSVGGEDGAGIYVLPLSGAEVRVRNTIVALNLLGIGPRNDCAGDPVISLGHNLLSTKGPAVACLGFDKPSDHVSGHPHLGDLKQNGGGTRTIALLAGSPAINKADPATAPGRDQRGFARHDPDIGAFERPS